MGHKYHQLTIEDREKIQSLLWEKKSFREIGRIMGRDHTTISREINRNKNWPYLRYTPRLAQEKAANRIRQRGQRLRLKNELTVDYVLKKLKLGWSPEQISGRLPRDHPGHAISHEAVYLYIYNNVNIYRVCKGEDLRIYLRRAHKVRRHRYSQYAKRSMIPNRIGIEQRSLVVARRKQFGHWEGDTMISRQSATALQTLVERVSGLVFVKKLSRLSPQQFSNAVISQLNVLPTQLRRTLTLDNGIENTKHETITEIIGTKCYFARPHHSWERGINENTNGLIRWYLPKKTDFSLVDDSQIHAIQYTLNTRPRKRLGYLTPLEVWSGALKG